MNLIEVLRQNLTTTATLDDANAAKNEQTKSSTTKLKGASDYAYKDIKIATVAAILQWIETDDLEEDESITDRLIAHLIGISDANKDGEITSDEQEILELALNIAYIYLADLGVDEEDLDLLLNDFDDEAAARIIEYLQANLPNDEDEQLDEINAFAFNEEDDETDALFDAVYRKKMVVRKGKKVKINKRVSGRVRLSAKQKMAIRKMHRKSHNAKAMVKRMKSMRIRRRSGL